MTAALGGTEGVERLQEDIEDGMADANEIQEAMSRQMDLPGVEGMDDDDLLAELEGLEEEELTAELSKVELAAPRAGVAMPAVPMSQPLPSAGTHAISAEEEDELAASSGRWQCSATRAGRRRQLTNGQGSCRLPQ